MDATGNLATRNGAARPRARLRRMGKALLTVIAPPLCLSCRTPIEATDALCAACWRRIDFITAPVCDRLGIPLPYDTGGPTVSAAALAHPPVYDRARGARSEAEETEGCC